MMRFLRRYRYVASYFCLNARNDDGSTTVTLPLKWNMKRLAGICLFCLRMEGRLLIRCI